MSYLGHVFPTLPIMFLKHRAFCVAMLYKTEKEKFSEFRLQVILNIPTVHHEMTLSESPQFLSIREFYPLGKD